MKYGRIYFLVIIIFLLGGGILGRLFSLQILQYEHYSALAQNQHQILKTLFPERGEILIQDLSLARRGETESYSPLATNKEFQQVYIIPRDIPQEEKENLAVQLADLLDLDKDLILERMNKPEDPYEPLKHKVSQSVAEQIENLEVEGLGVVAESWRYYPNDKSACHLLGFVGMSEETRVGQYGLEGYYEDELKGQAGFLAGEKDTAGYWIPSLSQKLEPAQDGAELILTIDRNIQFRAEKELSQVLEQWQAVEGTIIVMEPASGAIRAMASYPVFNPNEYGKVEDIDVFLNPAIQKTYEPGSVFKPITMAAGLDSGRVTPDSVYQDEGLIRIKGSTISNVDGQSYGQQTMTEVLEKSINTGAVFVQQEIGEEIFQDYVQRFNFGQLTGIDLASEVAGDILNLFTGREINLATISFGQGITVTPLELITAIGAIANNGRLMRPFIVEKVAKADGSETVTQPEIVGQPISSKTAKDLTRMLVSVVENGFGKPAGVTGYDIAGKTGTAQIADLEKGGYSDEVIHTFVGFAPAFDPKFIILIKLDKPQGIRFAADSVTPVFKRMAEYLFNYLEIAPE